MSRIYKENLKLNNKKKIIQLQLGKEFEWKFFHYRKCHRGAYVKTTKR